MKKLLVISLAVLLATLLVVSCSQDVKNVEDKVAIISFDANEKLEKSLTRTNPVLDAEEFWWSYTAMKTDGTQLVTGQTSVQKTIGTKGLTATVGAFSYGEWTFTLYGYADAGRTNLAYQGDSPVVINANTTTLAVTVQSQTAGAGSGYLQLPQKGGITLKRADANETAVTDYTKFVEKINIKPLIAITGQTEVTVYNRANDEGKTVRTFTLKSGSYEVTISYLQSATTDDEGATYTGGYVVAEDTIVVTIADYLTTKIGGDISENTSQITIVAQGEITKAVASVEIKESATTLDVEIPATPAVVSSEDSSSVPEVKKTTVSVPKELVDGNVSSAKLSVTSYTKEAVAETQPTIEITDSSSSISATAVVVGGLDIDLYVNNSEDKTTEFAANQVLTITTYIGTGLNGGNDYTYSEESETCGITVKYNGKGKADGTVQSYVASTGELTFTVDHLSSFYIAVNPVAKNDTTGTLYATLSDAISAAKEGEIISLKDNVTADFSSVELNTAVTIDLNTKTLTLNDSTLVTAENVTFKNGTMTGTGDSNSIAVNHGTLTLENVKATGVILYGNVTENSESKIKVSPAPKVGDILTMGKMPSGVLNYESYVGNDIAWKVLAVDEGKALVISEKLLDSKAHVKTTKDNKPASGYYWQGYLEKTKTDINSWLNDTSSDGFVAQYSLGSVSMVSVAHVTEKDQTYKEEKTTSEKIFILSKTEVEKYFSDETSRIANLFSGEASPWYLRTPAYDKNTANGNFYCYYVDSDGSFKIAAATSSMRIRPAFWISLATTLE